MGWGGGVVGSRARGEGVGTEGERWVMMDGLRASGKCNDKCGKREKFYECIPLLDHSYVIADRENNISKLASASRIYNARNSIVNQ